jgi:predicted DNA-binding protein YlxM (UPF0122 family)
VKPSQKNRENLRDGLSIGCLTLRTLDLIRMPYNDDLSLPEFKDSRDDTKSLKHDNKKRGCQFSVEIIRNQTVRAFSAQVYTG